MTRDRTSHRLTFAGTSLIALLLLVRVPSVVEPAAADQSLYTYVGQQVLAGGVPYRDAWDQKPPGIHFVYAGLWRVWPHESVVALADLVAAGLIAWLLVVLGRRTFGSGVGYCAACLFLLFGNPAFTRLGGVFVRSQCETFIALAVTAALVLATKPARGRLRLLGAGVCLAAAFWLKYNAAVYALPLLLAVACSPARQPRRGRQLLGDVAWVGAGFTAAALVVLAYFAAHGALGDLKLATIDYNVRYARETYGGLASVLTYPFRLVTTRVHVDALWFLAGVGAVLLSLRLRDRPVQIAFVWLAAAIVSIAANGSRGLPQYFVQANPALALVAGAGLLGLRGRTRALQIAAGTLLAVGLVWKVGDEPKAALRFAGVPGLIDNVRFDVAYIRGRIDRPAYLTRFGGDRPQDKFWALAVEQLAARVRETTAPTDSIYVFGFSPGVYVKSGRVSASRFLWSRPVILEFAARHPGYGSAGLVQELQRRAPALVALQRQDWGPVAAGDPGRHGEPNSIDFFHGQPQLNGWLLSHYVRDLDTSGYEVWRRRN
jgi:hypothetical protein